MLRGLTEAPDDWFGGATTAVLGAAAWWVAAGIGVRLGVTPRQFLRALALDFTGERFTRS